MTKEGNERAGATQIQIWIYNNCARMSDGHTGMGRKRQALLPGNGHIPLIHHEYREREGRREGLRERER